jgi:hypothetical protein
MKKFYPINEVAKKLKVTKRFIYRTVKYHMLAPEMRQIKTDVYFSNSDFKNIKNYIAENGRVLKWTR